MAIGETHPASAGVDQRKHFQALRSRLETIRSTFDAHWKELGEYFFPRRPRFFTSDKNRGDKRSGKIIDSTPRFAARTLQSGLHAGLTSPSRPWMKLTTPDKELAESAQVKVWLHIVTTRMLAVFNQSNLYNALPVLYGDLGVFGTAAMGVMPDAKDLFRCYVYPIGSFAFDTDARGLPSTFTREYELTVGQVVETFGFQDGRDPSLGPDMKKFSEAVQNAYNEKRTTDPVVVCWMIVKNPPEKMKGSRPWPYLSVYFETGMGAGGTGVGTGGVETTTNTELLRESGFEEFPIMLPRWDVTGEDVYGTDCPGMTALGDAKALQTMQKRKAQAVEKMVNPPLVGPSNLRTQKTSLLPGDITYADTREGLQGLRPIHDTKFPIQELTEDIRETQFRVSKAFYEDLFLMLASSDGIRGAQPPTAREIDERHEEKLLALGPVLERTNDELLDPLIDRVYAMMARAGLIPPPPPELSGVDLRVEYISLMSQAQKLVGVVAQDRFLLSVGQLSQLYPEARHKVDPFRAVDDYADQIGVDPSLVRTNDDALALAQQEAQAAAEAQAALVAKDQAAAAASTAKATSDEENSGLRRALGGVTG